MWCVAVLPPSFHPKASCSSLGRGSIRLSFTSAVRGCGRMEVGSTAIWRPSQKRVGSPYTQHNASNKIQIRCYENSNMGAFPFPSPCILLQGSTAWCWNFFHHTYSMGAHTICAPSCLPHFMTFWTHWELKPCRPSVISHAVGNRGASYQAVLYQYLLL